MRRLLCLCLLLSLLLLAACGSDDDETTTGADATATATEEAPAADGACQKAELPEPKADGDLAKPKETLDKAKSYTATIVTNCGEFTIALDAKRAPKTGGSFKYLADKGFFDNTIFHRVISGFVIQGGDPLGNGTGGAGYSVVEAPPSDLTYTRGVVAMAKTATEESGTSGSQFFVVVGEDVGLPPEYALLGKVTKGQDVVDKISVVPVNAENPVDPVVIQQVKVEAK